MIVGLGHRSRHGKDTVADFLVDWLAENRPGLKALKLPMAWKLKEIAHLIYGHLGLRAPAFYDTPHGATLRNVALPEIDLSPVEIWIKLGTPAIREQVWEQTWVSLFQAQAAHYDVVIAPDCRFPNEMAVVDYAINVHNPRVPRRQGISVDDALADWTGWNYTLLNDGPLMELRADTNDLARQLFANLEAN